MAWWDAALKQDAEPFEHTPGEARIAFYLAGQAVMAVSLGLVVEEVRSKDADGRGAVYVSEPGLEGTSRKTRADAIAVAKALMAGVAAQQGYSFGRLVEHIDRFFDTLAEEAAFWRALELLARHTEDTPGLITQVWHATQSALYADACGGNVEIVADAVLKNGELAGVEIEDILRARSV